MLRSPSPGEILKIRVDNHCSLFGTETQLIKTHDQSYSVAVSNSAHVKRDLWFNALKSREQLFVIKGEILIGDAEATASLDYLAPQLIGEGLPLGEERSVRVASMILGYFANEDLFVSPLETFRNLTRSLQNGIGREVPFPVTHI